MRDHELLLSNEWYKRNSHEDHVPYATKTSTCDTLDKQYFIDPIIFLRKRMQRHGRNSQNKYIRNAVSYSKGASIA